jgi:solute carrier family 35 protein F5
VKNPPATSSPPTSPLPTSTPPATLSPRARLLGDALSLLSAVCYGLYTNTLKKLTPDPDAISTPMFLGAAKSLALRSSSGLNSSVGFVGSSNVLLLWPVGLVLHFLNIERFQLPDGPQLLCVLLEIVFPTFPYVRIGPSAWH